jgi:hypothetical protein
MVLAAGCWVAADVQHSLPVAAAPPAASCAAAMRPSLHVSRPAPARPGRPPRATHLGNVFQPPHLRGRQLRIPHLCSHVLAACMMARRGPAISLPPPLPAPHTQPAQLRGTTRHGSCTAVHAPMRPADCPLHAAATGGCWPPAVQGGMLQHSCIPTARRTHRVLPSARFHTHPPCRAAPLAARRAAAAAPLACSSKRCWDAHSAAGRTARAAAGCARRLL